MNGWFELSKSAEGKFHFVLKGDNKETLLTSESYNSKDSAEHGIVSVRSNCASDEHYEKKVANNGKHFFNLHAANHQVIGTSHMYATPESRDAGVAAAKTAGMTTVVKYHS